MAASLSGWQRQDYKDALQNGWMAQFERTLPLWAGSSNLSSAQFRTLLVGRPMSDAGAEALQAAGRAMEGDDAAEASRQLAKAVQSGGRDWRYIMRWARDQTTYSAVHGKVGQAVETQPTEAGPAAIPVAGSIAAAGVPPVGAGVAPIVATGAGALELLGTVAAGVAAGAAIVLWPSPAGESPEQLRALHEPSGPTINEARTPKPSGRKDEPIGTHDKPPPGSKPIDETPWSGDHQGIKGGILSGSTDHVSVAPNGDVWQQHTDGSWSNMGPAENSTGSDKPTGQRGKDREGR